MKHMVRNDELLKQSGLEEVNPNLVIYSCELDGGEKVKNVAPIRLGADGMEIWFFPCFSCAQQLRDYVMAPVFRDAAKEAIIEKRQQESRVIVYRGVVLVPLPDYEVPERNSSEWAAVEREIDKYLDDGSSMQLVGFRVSSIKQPISLNISHGGARFTEEQANAIANKLRKAVE